jgi:3-deoxy-D-manno-octulosonic-acid transferase
VIFLYRLLFLPALLVVLPVFLWRTRGRGDWRQNFGNRFGRFANVPARKTGVPRIWLQAVSVGELLAVEPLLEPLQRATGAEIFLTTTTTTGFAVASERLRGRAALLGPAFFPVDFWPWSARAWRAIAPDLVILAEGERWPEHIHQAARRGVPVVCVNARLSDRGFRRARRMRGIATAAWRGITHVLASSESDAQRFRALGFGERVQVTGSIKLDVELPRLSPERVQALRRELGLSDGRIIVCWRVDLAG